MEFTELSLKGLWQVNHKAFDDDRGSFHEWFKSSLIMENTGREFKVAQSNTSTSKKNALRGIHYSTAPEGQAKWVTCLAGKILDVIVDLRPLSKTFKEWVSVELDSKSPQSLLIPEGMGHAFLALDELNVVSYLLTSKYNPDKEHEINPFDLDLGINWPDSNFIISQKDKSAKPFRLK
jgi:dTDP-4-dehydrorhamnose 3,5-epimerase